MSSRRFLGPLDAAADDRFRYHFVSQDHLKALVSPQSNIVYGAKGVGKTALRRALTELENRAFFATGTIDLDNLSFQRVHVELSKLKDTTGTEVLSLARATWRNVLAIYFLELLRARVPHDRQLCDRIDYVLNEEHFTDRDAPNRVLNQVERIFERLGSLAVESEATNDHRVAEVRRMAVDRFPPTERVGKLIADACALVAESGRSIAICIDGFDSIVDHQPESRKAIFAGLIDAIYRLSKDQVLSGALCVKAFLPKELTHEARAVVWDADKYLYNTIHLHWDDASLREFILKRLQPHLRGPKNTDFDLIWHEYMPPTIRNTVHGIDEASFAYILRHTQFRPRQLLYHVQMILDKWDQKSDKFKVDASFIPSAVAASNRMLAELVVNQLEYARPGLVGFMRSFGGGTSTTTYAECFSKIRRMFGTDPVETRGVFDELFDFGVIGVARRESVAKPTTTIKVRFVYAGEGVSKVHPADDDVVALCPMFHDFCGCTQSLYGAVIPSPV